MQSLHRLCPYQSRVPFSESHFIVQVLNTSGTTPPKNAKISAELFVEKSNLFEYFLILYVGAIFRDSVGINNFYPNRTKLKKFNNLNNKKLYSNGEKSSDGGC